MSIDQPDVKAFYGKLPELVPQKVNLNGSSKNHLMEDYKNVLNALRSLDAALGRATPHGRDYQTHHRSNEAFVQARMAWGTRRMLIAEMLDDIQHSAEMVYGQ